MLLIQNGFVVLGTTMIQAVYEAHTLGVDEPEIVASVQEPGWSEVFKHAQVELIETQLVQPDHTTVPVQYLTITVPLQDDQALASAYRLQEQVRGKSQEVPEPAEEGSDDDEPAG